MLLLEASGSLVVESQFFFCNFRNFSQFFRNFCNFLQLDWALPDRNPPPPCPKAAPKAKHVQLFKMKRKVGKGLYSVPVNQNESE